MKNTLFYLFAFILLAQWSFAQTAPKVDGRSIPFEVFGSYKMQGSLLSMELPALKSGQYQVFLDGEQKSSFKEGAYSLNVPQKPGLHRVQVMKSNQQILMINLFVMTPIAQKEGQYLNGYRIGNYPPALGENGRYQRPLGFIELTQEVLEAQVSPHFKIKQFAPKQKGSPRYMVLREDLILKLEYILTEIKKANASTAETLKITSAYMTPHANAEAGNAIYSRHIYGDAVTFIVDKHSDGIMDDLNHDGKMDMKDVRWLFDLIDQLSARPDYQKLEGGLAHYKSMKKKSGYIYIDARGKKMRF